MNCNGLIINGMILRYILTVILFYLLYINNTYINKYLYLILPILLSILDDIDNVFTRPYKYNWRSNNRCTHLYFYQITDKICDSISYLLLSLFFKLDNILLFFVIYRIIGVILFYYTKNSKWLIFFFDFAKEYLLYFFLFGKNYVYIPFFIFGKICFEYYFHTIHNKNDYK